MDFVGRCCLESCIFTSVYVFLYIHNLLVLCLFYQVCDTLRSLGIDSKESIPPAYVALQAGTTTLSDVPGYIGRRNRFLGPFFPTPLFPVFLS
jgi:hypothetical protein